MFYLFLSATALLSILELTIAHKELDWWQSSVIYQIYPLSFKDSDGDGFGDLNGIHEKLDYIKQLGVDVIWIQSFYKSPMLDHGYDISDYKSINPLFGVMDDFNKLLKGIHDRGMKLILDFVPNHTSDECRWFQLSLQGIEPYKDYYVYRNAKKLNATHFTYPNNWRSVYGGPAWTWRTERKQYSLNQFSSKQPELNLRNPKLREELNNVLRYWLDKGVDGFRVDSTKYLFEAAHFKNEPRDPDANFANDYYNLVHNYTVNQRESYDLIKSWRAIFDEYKKEDDQTRLMTVADYDTPDHLKKYLGNTTHPGAHFPFYGSLVAMDYKTNSLGVESMVRMMTDTFPDGNYNWVQDNHNNLRVSSRFNPESVDSWNIFTLLLPGVACIYFGSELGLEDIKPRPNRRRDPQNAGSFNIQQTRDASRGPMLWDDTMNAGFTKAKRPWLPINPNYYRTNVKTQEESQNSHLTIFKRIVQLRKTPVIQYGDFYTFKCKEWVYIFTRSLQNDTIAVLMNIGAEMEEVCGKTYAPKLPEYMFVHTSSIQSGLRIGNKIKLSDSDGTNCIQMRPFSTLVLSTSHGIQVVYSITIILFAILCSSLTGCLLFLC